ncbi:MAG: hypothetical protein NT087_03175 [Deltaproteobacteria bacterium]|nr:hypothetical protein [Deltaproteobacteria bacterium]
MISSISTSALAAGVNGDAVIGGALGGAAGAAVGSAIGGRDGAMIGAGLGGVAGVAVATSDNNARARGRGNVGYAQDNGRHRGHHKHHRRHKGHGHDN